MAYYSPAQSMWLQYAMKTDPSLLPGLYNQFSQVAPIDQHQTEQFANAQRDQYMRNVVNPAYASSVVKGGTTDNSFSASRAAAAAAQGAAQAQGVYNDAYAAQNANQMALQSYNQQAADAAYKGFENSYGPEIARRAGQNPTQFKNMGMSSPMSYLYGYRSMSPQSQLARLGSGLGGAFGQASNYMPQSGGGSFGQQAGSALGGMFGGPAGGAIGGALGGYAQKGLSHLFGRSGSSPGQSYTAPVSGARDYDMSSFGSDPTANTPLAGGASFQEWF